MNLFSSSSILSSIFIGAKANSVPGRLYNVFEDEGFLGAFYSLFSLLSSSSSEYAPKSEFRRGFEGTDFFSLSGSSIECRKPVG
jgi:hypothetical protein